MNGSEDQTVRSADGTRIGFAKLGSGQIPVVIVHGALSAGARWRPVAIAMAEHCTCYLMDRWGRGASENRTEYSLEREVDDIGAVIEAAGPGAYVLGHSSGAIYALEAARRYSIAGLVLYEPPLHAYRGRFVETVLPRVRVAARQGRFQDVVSIFLSGEVGIPANELARMQATPLWEEMVALAPQSVREWEELADLGLTIDRYRDVRRPILLLAGTLTKNHPSFATRALESTLPDVRTVMLDGQGHVAHMIAPELVAKEVSATLRHLSRGRSGPERPTLDHVSR